MMRSSIKNQTGRTLSNYLPDHQFADMRKVKAQVDTEALSL